MHVALSKAAYTSSHDVAKCSCIVLLVRTHYTLYTVSHTRALFVYVLSYTSCFSEAVLHVLCYVVSLYCTL